MSYCIYEMPILIIFTLLKSGENVFIYVKAKKFKSYLKETISSFKMLKIFVEN